MPHGLDTRHRTTARVGAIRSPYPGVDTLAPSGAAAIRTAGADASEGRLAPVVHLGDRAARPARDGATRESYASRIDAQNRVNLGKALSALGWTPDTFLVAARENGHIVVRAAADSPLLTPVPVDAQRRLTLPPAILGGLDVRPGDQVLAGVVVDTAELHLFAVADALQLLTGALPAAARVEVEPQPAPMSRAPGGSRIRSRWRAVDRDVQRPADGG